MIEYYQGRGNVRAATGNIIDPTKHFKQKNYILWQKW